MIRYSNDTCEMGLIRSTDLTIRQQHFLCFSRVTDNCVVGTAAVVLFSSPIQLRTIATRYGEIKQSQ